MSGTPLRVVASVLAALTLASAAEAQETTCELGLVLSGGGARGVAHLGVLQVLEEHGVRPDCIAGASMGAVVGALYATGHSTESIETLLASLSWRSLYVESHNRRLQPILHRIEQQRTGLRLGISDGVRTPRGVLSDTMVNRMLIEHLAPASFAAGRRFDALPIPFRTVGTDLRTGDRIVLDRGDLARAVRGSMSVPLAYPAVEWDEALLVDGGLVDNVPVSLAEDMGASFVIAVDVQTPLSDEVVPDVVGVTRRIVDLLFAAKNRQFERPADIEIVPEIGDHSFADYSGFDRLIRAGRTAAMAALGEIPARYRQRPMLQQSPVDSHVFGDRTIQAIQVSGNRYLSDAVILREFAVRVGEPMDWPRMLADLEHLYTSGLLQSAWLDLEAMSDDGVRVLLHVQEEYRNTADIGLAYHSDDQVQGLLRFETRNLFGSGERLQITGSASSTDRMFGVRLHAEEIFGAHVGYQLDALLHVERPKVFQDGELVRRAEFRRRDLRVGTNLPFGMSHLLQLGARFGEVETVERVGIPFAPAVERQRVLSGRYIWDNLDSLSLPESGVRTTILGERNGGDHIYWRLRVDSHGVRRLGRAVFEARVAYGFSSAPLPVYEKFRVGGPELIPGVARDELWGDQMLALSGQVGYDPASLIRLYARIGVGGVWDEPGDVNLGDATVGAGIGLTVATPIGPLQLDYGWAQDNRSRLYFAIGWQ